MTTPSRHLASVSLLALAAASCAEAPDSKANTDPQPAVLRGASARTELSAIVEAVDVERRLITLKGPLGNVGVYRVGEQVQRLPEIRAGDTIKADYLVALLAELREPTAEEKKEPLVILEGAERASLDALPAAGLGRAVRAVTTIEAVDRPAQTLTVKGPMGNRLTTRVDDVAVLERLQVGQTIVVTFLEALQLSAEARSKRD